MIIEAGFVIAVGTAAYLGVKHYGLTTVVAAVKAEVAKFEAEAAPLVAVEEAKAKAAVLAIVARLKALL